MYGRLTFMDFAIEGDDDFREGVMCRQANIFIILFAFGKLLHRR